jgi:hypothetical protein
MFYVDNFLKEGKCISSKGDNQIGFGLWAKECLATIATAVHIKTKRKQPSIASFKKMF